MFFDFWMDDFQTVFFPSFFSLTRKWKSPISFDRGNVGKNRKHHWIPRHKIRLSRPSSMFISLVSEIARNFWFSSPKNRFSLITLSGRNFKRSNMSEWILRLKIRLLWYILCFISLWFFYKIYFSIFGWMIFKSRFWPLFFLNAKVKKSDIFL